MVYLPALIQAHGCEKVDLSNATNFLAQDTDFVPEAMKDFAEQYPNATGVYDCHEGENENEVGYAGLCNNDGSVCACTALFNFQVCASCALTCGTGTANGTDLAIESFTADCSNVQPRNNVLGPCTVGCGYSTDGCFEDAASPVSSAPSFPGISKSVMAGLTIGLWY